MFLDFGDDPFLLGEGPTDEEEEEEEEDKDEGGDSGGDERLV